MDLSFIGLLLASGITGLALMVLRATAAMSSLLAIHLAVVLALFVTLPFGKFVHGIYRVRRSAPERCLSSATAISARTAAKDSHSAGMARLPVMPMSAVEIAGVKPPKIAVARLKASE